MTHRMTKAAIIENFGHLVLPVILLVVLFTVSVARGPSLLSTAGFAGAIVVLAPLILSTMAITPIALVGRGGVDLSVGPLVGFINVTLVSWLVGHEVSNPIAVVGFALAIGVAYQLIFGLVVVYVRVAPIIVALSGFLILGGINLEVMDRPSGVAPSWMATWGRGTHIFSPVLLIIVAAVLLWFAISRTAFFSQLRLTGADERTAFTSGIPVDRVRLGAHALAGVYAGLAAIAYTALIGSGDPTQGTNYTLSAVTALVLGGTSLSGGRGGALGSILGAIDMYLISYVLATFSFGMVSGFVTRMSFGIVLLASLQVGAVMLRSRSRELQ